MSRLLGLEKKKNQAEIIEKLIQMTSSFYELRVTLPYSAHEETIFLRLAAAGLI